jgi:hypothetical protein
MVRNTFGGERPMDDRELHPPARIVREKRTVAAMIGIYCHAHHGTTDILCGQCMTLFEYACCRLDRCPYGDAKTPCAMCPTHCYQSLMRTRIKEVMRYAGPRMLLRHPILALRHQWDSLTKENKKTKKKEPNDG